MSFVGGTIRTTHSWSPCVPLTAAHLLSSVTQQPQTACGLVQLSYRWSVILIKTPHWDPPGNWMHNGTMCRRAPLICEKLSVKGSPSWPILSLVFVVSRERAITRVNSWHRLPFLISKCPLTSIAAMLHRGERSLTSNQPNRLQSEAILHSLNLMKSWKKNAKRTLTMFPLGPAFPSTPGSPCRHQELMMNLSEIEHLVRRDRVMRGCTYTLTCKTWRPSGAE